MTNPLPFCYPYPGEPAYNACLGGALRYRGPSVGMILAQRGAQGLGGTFTEGVSERGARPRRAQPLSLPTTPYIRVIYVRFWVPTTRSGVSMPGQTDWGVMSFTT